MQLFINSHFAFNLAIALADFTIPLWALQYHHRIPSRLFWAARLLGLFILSCGIGHALDAFSVLYAMHTWYWVTATVSWVAAIFFIFKLDALLSFLEFGDLLLRYDPSGVGIFAVGIAPDGKRDLLWVGRSQEAVSDLGFDPLVTRTWLGIAQPEHRKKLLNEYLHVLDTGEPILNREIYYNDPKALTRGHFLQNVIKISDTRLLITWRNITQLKQTQAELEHLASTDALTGLGNRYALNQTPIEQFTGAAFIDLDRFKAVNDTLGHDVGDDLLCMVVQRIVMLLADGDRPFRLGGDEFFILFNTPKTLEGLLGRAKTLLEEVQRPYFVGNRELRIGASIGVVDRSAGDLPKMLRAADIAMYTAKQIGGVALPWNEDLIATQVHKEQIAIELQTIRHRYDREFELHYQPIVRLDNPIEWVGLEALLRWRSSKLGFVCPADFIPIAEDTGEITRISNWVIENATKQSAAWSERFPISVNVSPWDLEQPNFIPELRRFCLLHGIDVSSIALEITERAVSGSLLYYENVLRELTAMRVALKIDDFGTGESSLKRLLEHRWETVKIDRSLVPIDENDRTRVGICQAVAHLCRDLEILTVAEGVETKEQLQLLRDIGIDAGQGYYFARPMPGSEIVVE